MWHLDVNKQHIGSHLIEDVREVSTGGGDTDHRDVGEGTESLAQTIKDEHMVVGNDDRDRLAHWGPHATVTLVPLFWADTMEILAPIELARSFIPTMP